MGRGLAIEQSAFGGGFRVCRAIRTLAAGLSLAIGFLALIGASPAEAQCSPPVGGTVNCTGNLSGSFNFNTSAGINDLEINNVTTGPGQASLQGTGSTSGTGTAGQAQFACQITDTGSNPTGASCTINNAVQPPTCTATNGTNQTAACVASQSTPSGGGPSGNSGPPVTVHVVAPTSGPVTVGGASAHRPARRGLRHLDRITRRQRRQRHPDWQRRRRRRRRRRRTRDGRFHGPVGQWNPGRPSRADRGRRRRQRRQRRLHRRQRRQWRAGRLWQHRDGEFRRRLDYPCGRWQRRGYGHQPGRQRRQRRGRGLFCFRRRQRQSSRPGRNGPGQYGPGTSISTTGDNGIGIAAYSIGGAGGSGGGGFGLFYSGGGGGSTGGNAGTADSHRGQHHNDFRSGRLWHSRPVDRRRRRQRRQRVGDRGARIIRSDRR